MSTNESVCKNCRRYKVKLFLKGDRCDSPKCALTKRTYGPGIHGQSRRRLTEYAKQLAEKQKAKATYGLREQQFRNYYESASASKKNTSEELIRQLETRLDNVIYRSGFAPSRAAARQLVKHGKILVNNKKVDIPSYQLKTKDLITAKNKDIKLKKTEIPVWLTLDKKSNAIEVVKMPELNDSPLNFSTELIVEFYSR